LPRWIPAFFLVVSYYFYAGWNYKYLPLLIFSTVLDFYFGKWIYAANEQSRKKLIVICSVVLNLSILGFFKYYNFLIGSITYLIEFGFHKSVNLPLSSFLLPLGISFYTFESMSYNIDIYRGKLTPQKSLIKYATFVSYFPHLIAGPIVRPHLFFPYLEDVKIDMNKIFYGVGLFSIGVFKKMIIADMLAVTYVESVFSRISYYSVLDVMLATLGYAFQIYNDFSAYSDMAIGLGFIFGFQFPENFNYPYLSKNIRDFWTRWHISLSTWLRDYLYISLGGNQNGRFQKYKNIFITMFLGGLWHGAAWNFVIWGAYHGILIIISHLRNDLFKEKFELPAPLQYLLTFVLVCIGWFFFRVQNLHEILDVGTRIFDFKNEYNLNVVNKEFWIVLLIAFIQLVLGAYKFKENFLKIYMNQSIFLKAALPVGAFLLIVVFSIYGYQPFIYFRF
jgi:alginate O-acetyltransferase complex protein AlgI